MRRATNVNIPFSRWFPIYDGRSLRAVFCFLIHRLLCMRLFSSFLKLRAAAMANMHHAFKGPLAHRSSPASSVPRSGNPEINNKYHNVFAVLFGLAREIIVPLGYYQSSF